MFKSIDKFLHLFLPVIKKGIFASHACPRSSALFKYHYSKKQKKHQQENYILIKVRAVSISATKASLNSFYPRINFMPKIPYCQGRNLPLKNSSGEGRKGGY